MHHTLVIVHRKGRVDSPVVRFGATVGLLLVRVRVKGITVTLPLRHRPPVPVVVDLEAAVFEHGLLRLIIHVIRVVGHLVKIKV